MVLGPRNWGTEQGRVQFQGPLLPEPLSSKGHCQSTHLNIILHLTVIILEALEKEEILSKASLNKERSGPFVFFKDPNI